ncbi:MAG: D-aminoacyl-tRNA deacylase [Candidatus Thermoplasmatota archaeon]
MRDKPLPWAMRVLVASEPDAASVNQRSALLALTPWAEAGTFEGAPAYRHGEWALLTIRELHLERDHLDRDIESAMGERPELIVYLSKHRSESRTPSLTVHPIGNPKGAEFGGRPGTFVPASPLWMTAALRRLRVEAQELPYEVTFEATHHGPYLETPTFFIEQGSTAREWEDLEASKAIARTLLDLRPADAPVALGLGGGHYVPRHSDLAVARRIAFGHLLPSHALEGLPPERIDAAIGRTPGASLAYLHRKSLRKPEARDLEALVGARGLRVVREADLDSAEENKTS